MSTDPGSGAVACGSWLLKFKLSDAGKLVAWDADYGLTSFSEGASFSIDLWARQLRVCETYKSVFVDTRANQFIALHADVLTARDVPLLGVRYIGDESNSGWWIYPESYDGHSEGFTSVKPTHVDHLVAARPDLVELLGLEAGFCFRTLGIPPGEAEVWFEQAIADDEE